MKPDPSDHRIRAIGVIADIMAKDVGDHAIGRRLHAEIERLRQGAKALDEVNARRSPLDTPAAHAMKIAKMARKFDQEVTATINRSGLIFSEGYKDANRRIDEKVNLTPDAFAGEIRATFRTLNAKAQSELVKVLIQQNRGPELAAIVKAPSILTGVTDRQRADYEQAILGVHAPAELEEQELISSAFDTIMIAAKTAGGFAKSLTEPASLAEIERAAAASDAAGAAFDQSLQ